MKKIYVTVGEDDKEEAEIIKKGLIDLSLIGKS